MYKSKRLKVPEETLTQVRSGFKGKVGIEPPSPRQVPRFHLHFDAIRWIAPPFRCPKSYHVHCPPNSACLNHISLPATSGSRTIADKDVTHRTPTHRPLEESGASSFNGGDSSICLLTGRFQSFTRQLCQCYCVRGRRKGLLQ